MVVTRPVRRWEHRILCAVLCLLAVLPVLASDEIDLLVRARMQEQRLPGAAYVVMRSGVAVDFGVYGFANLELLVPVTPETVFQVGSLSKQFAARALLMLVDDGKVRLDDPLNRYLPKPVPEWERITLYHVLTHTSGIPNWGDFAEFSFHDDYSAEAYVAILREKNLEFRPGDRFLYSSAAYSLLSIVIEKISGMPFGDFLEARIFRPAGMNSTKLNDPLSLVPGRSQGYVIRENRVINGVNLRPAVTAPSGGVLTTIGDLARYERILREAPDLSEASNAQILRPVRLNSGQRFPYGMGWYLKDARHIQAAYHTGTTAAGFRAAYFRQLRTGISVVFLCNASGDGVDPLVIAEMIAQTAVRDLTEVSQ